MACLDVVSSSRRRSQGAVTDLALHPRTTEEGSFGSVETAAESPRRRFWGPSIYRLTAAAQTQPGSIRRTV